MSDQGNLEGAKAGTVAGQGDEGRGVTPRGNHRQLFEFRTKKLTLEGVWRARLEIPFDG